MFVLFLILEGQYSLIKRDGSKKYSYICETAKSEAFRIIQDDRDFSKINLSNELSCNELFSKVFRLLPYFTVINFNISVM